MKKYFPYTIILVLVVGFFTPTHVAHADWWNPGTWSVPNVFPSVSDLFAGLVWVVVQALVSFLSFFLWMAGQMLNYVLDYTIVHMSEKIEPYTGIRIAWQTVRDLMNIMFIFFLLYEAVLLIIGLRSRDKVGKFVGMLVLSALLINFSLFFTKVLIDASNVVTIGVYNAILGERAGERDLWGYGFPYGLSNPIVKHLGIVQFYGGVNPFADDDPNKPNPNKTKGPSSILIMGLGTSAVMLVATFIFFVVSILFLVRYVVLIILLMLSPVAYMGMAFPAMSEYSKQWWESLKGQLLFPPIYMVLTWVVLTLIGSRGFLKDPATGPVEIGAAAIGEKSLASIDLLVNFIIVVGLLIASIIIAKKTASQGATMIGKATNGLTAFAGGAVMGGAGWAGRKTFGAYADRIANDDSENGLKARARNSFRAKMQLKAARGVASSSFDARAMANAIPGVDLGLGKGTKGIPFLGDAKAGEGGYRKAQEEKAKKAKEFEESLKISDAELERRKSLVEAEKEREEELKKAEFDNNEARQARLAQEKQTQQDKITTTQTEITGIQNQISENERKITEAESRVRTHQQLLETTGDLRELAKIQEKIDAENTLKTNLNKQINDFRTDIVKKNKDVENATNEIVNIQNRYKAERARWMSDKMKGLIKNAGGQDKLIDPDTKLVIQEAVENGPSDAFKKSIEGQVKRMNETADYIADKNNSALKRYAMTVWHGRAGSIRESAAKVRSINKKKSAKDLIDEALKTGEMSESIPVTTPEPETTPPPTPPTI